MVTTPVAPAGHSQSAGGVASCSVRFQQQIVLDYAGIQSESAPTRDHAVIHEVPLEWGSPALLEQQFVTLRRYPSVRWGLLFVKLSVTQVIAGAERLDQLRGVRTVLRGLAAVSGWSNVKWSPRLSLRARAERTHSDALHIVERYRHQIGRGTPGRKHLLFGSEVARFWKLCCFLAAASAM